MAACISIKNAPSRKSGGIFYGLKADDNDIVISDVGDVR